MKIKVIRSKSNNISTISKFYFNDKQMGVGVEDVRRDVKIKNITCIPEGVYEMGFHISSKFSSIYFRDDEGNLIESKDRILPEEILKYKTPHEMIQVLNVPNYEYILWHFGNSASDTEGCYIVGSSTGMLNDKAGIPQLGVMASRIKYKEIYPIIFKALKSGKVIVEYKLEDNEGINK